MHSNQSLTFDNESLARWIQQNCQTDPNATALVCQGQSLTYGELDLRARSLAAGLRDLGIRKGDIVAIQLPNIAEFVVSYLAISGLGAVTQTLHMPYRYADLKQLLGHSEAVAAICLDHVKDASPAEIVLELREEIDSLEHVIVVGEAPDGSVPYATLAEQDPLSRYEAVDEHDRFLLLYTSGTTAEPKGVPHCYGNFLGNASRCVEEFQFSSGDRLMPVAPLSHLYGLYVLHLALSVGATVVLLPVFSPPGLMDTVKQYKPTAIFAAPAHFAAAFGLDLIDTGGMPDTRLTCLSGTTVPPELARKVDGLMPNGQVIQLWGMSEIQAGSFGRPSDSADSRQQTAGRASPGTELRIVDGEGRVSGSNTEGELQMRGASVFAGYLKNEDATRESFTAEGWFRTGDLATIDAHGFLTITGRTKEIIDRGGIKFNPLEVEKQILQMPEVVSVAMVPMADPVLGERACAFLQLTPNSILALEDILDTLKRAGVAKYKWPEAMRIIEEMPVTPTQKVKRGDLKAML